MRIDAVDRRAPQPEWIMAPWSLPIWLGGLLWGWWQHAAAELAAHAGGHLPRAGVPLAALVAGAVAIKVAGWLIEAAFYRAVWASAGARLAYWRLAIALGSFSVADLLAHTLRGVKAWAHSPVMGALVGPTPASGADLLASVVAGFGLCAIARIVCTALVQARALRRPLALPLALTLAAVAITRLASALLVDLARGRSPL